jgi:Fe-S-cluster containining protein
MNKAEFYNLHTRLTRSLRRFVEDYESQLDAETFSAFLESISAEIAQRAAEFQTLESDEGRARLLHRLVDAEAATSDIPLSCKKGCSACCHMEVEVTSYETGILKAIIDGGHKIDRERLLRQSLRSLQDPAWKQGTRNPENRCVFLNQEGSCSIYENRPVMCRRHSVSTPAIHCDTPDAPITLRYFPRVDLMISAANEDPKMQIGPLAKMLTQALLDY